MTDGPKMIDRAGGRRADGDLRSLGRRSPLLRHLSMVLVGLCALVGASLALGSCQPAGATLHGRLTDASTSTVKAGVPVALYSSLSDTVVASTVTDTDGDYTFGASAVPAGTYRVLFAASDWWVVASNWGHATDVVLDGSTPVTINETFAVPMGSLSGTVNLNPFGGTPLGGVTVRALTASNGQVVASTMTASDGTYSLTSLPAGAYKTQFSLSGYSTRYNDGLDVSVPNGVTVVAGANTTVNSYLTVQLSITGQVFDGSTPVGGIHVLVNAKSNGAPVALTTTDSTGSFSVGALDPGNYQVGFFDPDGSRRAQMYGSPTYDLSKGTTVLVAYGVNTSITENLVGQECDPSVFFNGANLAGHDLSGENLNNCDLTGVNLTGANLTGTQMVGANVTNAVLTTANLTNANLSGATGVNSTIIGTDQTAGLASATLVGTNLSNDADALATLDLSGKDLTGTDFTNDLLLGMNFDSANVTNAIFTGSTLYLASMTNLVGINTTIIGTDQSAGLLSANMNSVNFAGSNINWSGLDAYNKDFTGANLTGANLSGANLSGANFYATNVTGANLSGANMTSAQALFRSTGLASATLTGTNLSHDDGAVYGLDLSRKDLTGTNFTDDDLTQTNFADANLTSADLTRTTLTNTFFFNTTLTGVISAAITGTPSFLPPGWSIVGGVLVFSR